MDTTALRKEMLDVAFEDLPGSVTATVTPKGGAAIEDVPALWQPNQEGVSHGPGGIQRNEPLRIIAFKLTDVPTLPAGSTIVAPEMKGGADRTWQTDGPEHREADHRRVKVVPKESS